MGRWEESTDGQYRFKIHLKKNCLHVVRFQGISVIMMWSKTKVGKLKVGEKGGCPITQPVPPLWLALIMSMDVGNYLVE